MSQDLVPHYRRKLVAPQRATSSDGTSKDDYVAFEGKDRTERLVILPARELADAPFYALLANIEYDHKEGAGFVLMFGFMSVRVTGKNLLPVVTALRMGTAAFIQQFDPDKWNLPTDKNAPLIDSITIEPIGAMAPGGADGQTVH